MTLCNNNNYVSKNYLNVFKIVPVKMESAWLFNALANALNGDFGLRLLFTYFHSHNLGLIQLITGLY